MKTLLGIIACLVLMCGSAFGQAVLVQAKNNNASSGGGANVDVTVTSTGSGNLLFALGVSTQSTNAITVSSTNNTWTAITGINSSTACFHSQFTNAGCQAAYTCNSVSGDTTIHFAGPGFSAITGVVLEFSGVATSSCSDQVSALVAVAAGSPISSNNITTSQSDLVIGIATVTQPAGLSAGTGYTTQAASIVSDAAGAATDVLLEWSLNHASGTFNATAGTTAGSGGIGVVSFKLAAASATSGFSKKGKLKKYGLF